MSPLPFPGTGHSKEPQRRRVQVAVPKERPRVYSINLLNMGFKQLGPAAKRRFKHDVYSALTRIPAALSNPHRLELLELLAQRPRTVADIANETALSIANASQHLRVLAKCGLVSVDRRGTYAHYRVADSKVYRLLLNLREVAEQNDSRLAVTVHKHLGERDAGVTDYDVLHALIADPHVALLDTRDAEEYAAGHLPRAINTPLTALRSGKVTLPKSKRYVAYCRGPYCTFADEAVAILRESGFDAARIAIGPIEWEAAGKELCRAG